jgi:hypothetical protein
MILHRLNRRMGIICFVAFAVLSQGCQSDTRTDAWRARFGERLAMDAVTCCAGADAASKDRCTIALLDRMDAVENHLEMLDAACRSGNEVATDRAIEQLASLVGNVVVAGTNGEPANGLPVLCSADTVRCDLRWSQAREAVAQAANGTSVERWTLAPGSVVTASVSGVVVEVRLTGSIEIPNENVPAVGRPARTPTSVALVAEWGDKRVSLSLDKACAWNETTATHLRVGLRPVTVDPRLHAELSAYPTLFMVLPFRRLDDGRATSVTDGAVPGTLLFPSYFGAIGAGAFDAAAGPNCGDSDADGIPNIAERIRGYFERGSGRPDAGKKGI